MPRPRKPDPTIPAHIDQTALPRGLYWSKTGRGRWYIRTRDDSGTLVCKTIATRNARLAELHQIMDQQHNPQLGTLDGLFTLFHASPAFRALAAKTQADYTRSRGLISGHPTKLGVRFGTLKIERLSAPVIQRLVDAIAERTPTTAAHVLQYLRRVVRWGVNRGHCTHNPVQSVEAPTLTPRRRLPTQQTHLAILEHARDRGARQAHTGGSVAPYLWICMELAYLCHLRGIELLDLRESQATADHLVASRRKGSRTTAFRWSPRLKAAWDAALAQRNAAWAAHRRPVPLRAEDRPVIVNQSGHRLTRSGLDTAWQRLMHSAIHAGVIEAQDRFGLHDLKRKGITDRPGTRADKQLASGHRSGQMLDVYDLSVPVADPAQTG